MTSAAHDPTRFAEPLARYLATSHGAATAGGAASVTIRCAWPEAHANGDAHPSMRVDLVGGVWRCDPCGKGGGALELVGALEKCDAKRALEILGIPPLQERGEAAGGAGAAAPARTRSGGKKKSIAQLREIQGRYIAALFGEEHERAPHADEVLAWLSAHWRVERATLELYAVGLGPLARGSPMIVAADAPRTVETWSLAVGSTDARAQLRGIKIYRPRWKEFGLDPNLKAIAEIGSTPGLVGGHLLPTTGSFAGAAGKVVIVTGGEKDALVVSAALERIAPGRYVVVANARGEGGWGGKTADDPARELAGAVLAARPAQVVIVLDVNEADRGTPACAAAFARAGAAPALVRAIAWPDVFSAMHPKGGAAQFLLNYPTSSSDRDPDPTARAVALSNLIATAPEAVPAAVASLDSIEIRTSDLGNALRLVAAHGDRVRFCPRWGKWLVWDKRRWRIDDTHEIDRIAQRTIAALHLEAAKSKDSDERKELGRHALNSESRRALSSMIDLAARQAAIVAQPDDFDADPWLFNAANGTVNLRTGELRPHRPEDMITKLAQPVATDHRARAPIPYDPAAECPVWLNFLAKTFDAKEDLISFLQRAIGYSLTGSIREQVIFILHGTGANGKSTFLDTIRALLGEYSQVADFSSFAERDKETVRNDLADLAGARLVTASETKDQQKLDDAVVKKLTGGDPIKSRFLFCEYFVYTPTFKIFLATNHRPTVRGGEHAIWRRIRLIPFNVTFADADQDRELPKKLQKELAGVLSWAVRGCLDWQRQGLGTARDILAATEEYRQDMDVVARWKSDRCVEVPDVRVGIKDLYGDYTKWCEENGDTANAQKWFSTRLSEKGFKKVKSMGIMFFVGLTIRKSREGEGGLEDFRKGPITHAHLNDLPENPPSPSLPPWTENPPRQGGLPL